jgi:hypothetical protein
MNGHYVGEWQDMNRHGEGVCTDADGTYMGQWVQGKRSGLGVWVVTGGERYEGKWSDNQYVGHGKLTFANGSVFEGNFVLGEFKGTLSVKPVLDAANAAAESAKLTASKRVLEVGKSATQSKWGRQDGAIRIK